MDPGGFERIFEENGPLVWSVIQAAGVPRDDAEDVFMESWEAIAEGISSFAGKSKLTTWITGIARRKCIDHLRKKCPEQPADPAEIDRLDEGVSDPRAPRGEHALSPSLCAVTEEARAHIVRAIRALPPLHRTVFTLWMEGFPYTTIAGVVNRSQAGRVDENHIGVILVRAKASIRALLRRAGIRAVEDLV